MHLTMCIYLWREHERTLKDRKFRIGGKHTNKRHFREYKRYNVVNGGGQISR